MSIEEEFGVKIVAESAMCPICGKDTVVVSKREHMGGDLEGVTEIFNHCRSCSYRASDVYPSAGGEPKRYTFRVRSSKDLDVRIVKSSTATVHLPELGVDIEPGPASKGYITNVQGVLERVKDAIRMARAWETTDEGRTRCDEKIASLDAIIDGGPFTPFRLVLEDIFGNCLIIAKRAKAATLSPEEVDRIVTRE